MSEDQESGMSGMMIGIIAGGIVMVMLVLGIVGVGFFFVMPHHADVAHEEFAPVADVPLPPPMGAPPLDEAQPLEPEVPKKVIAKEHERIVGWWQTTWPDDTKAIIRFSADGTVRLIKESPGDGNSVSMTCTWEVLESKGDHFTIRRAHANGNYVVEQDFEFQGNDRLVIRGPFGEKDTWVKKGPDGKVTYRKR